MYGELWENILQNKYELTDEYISYFASDSLFSWALGELSVYQAAHKKLLSAASDLLNEKFSGKTKLEIKGYPEAIEYVDKVFKKADYKTINRKVIAKIYKDSKEKIDDMREAAISTAQKIIKKSLDAGISRETAIQELKKIGISRGYAENVYRTNTQTAVNAATYNRAVDSGLAEGFRFVAVGDSRTRPNHNAANGLEDYIDSKWWDGLYAPLGFNCRCTIIVRLIGNLRKFIPSTINNARADSPQFGKRPILF